VNRPKLISVVIPTLNERHNVALVHERVSTVFEHLNGQYEVEFVFTDNRSSDGTFDEIVRLAALDPRIRAYRFSRNFGYQRSILEGLRQARGDAAIEMDADLQDPPELIPEFLRLWEEGHAVVYGVREKRPDPWHIGALRRAFYRIANRLSEDPLPLDAGDFRLVDRRVLDVLKSLEDAQPYLRGTIAAMGFEQAGVRYQRDARQSGESKFSFGALVALSIDGILNHSIVPLRLATYTGLAVSLLSVVMILGYVVGRFAFGLDWPPGFATTTTLILLGIALNSLFLGVIGEYLGRIYKQVKRGPNTVIDRAIGAEADEMPT
jgi:dolichol-phosphate mannosyltransferase